MANGTAGTEKKKSGGTKKVMIVSLALMAVAAIVLAVVLLIHFTGGIVKNKTLFNRKPAEPKPSAIEVGYALNERDIALNVGKTLQLQLVSTTNGDPVTDIAVTWKSDHPAIASVSETGVVKAVKGGETVIKANFEYEGIDYSLPCVTTVKTANGKYASYRVRYFTQSKDRSSYSVAEEVYERAVGSKVKMSEAEASRRLPGNYTLRKDKSVLSGTVKEKTGCVLEVYYDVAEITYYVDYYYESATALGTYAEKETKAYKCYAFESVQASANPKEGFVQNTKAPGSILSNDSVTDGVHLVAFYDRARGQATVNYASGKESKTYNYAYGHGLIDADEKTVFDDSVDPLRLKWTVSGKDTDDPSAALRASTGDVTVASELYGSGMVYDAALGGVTGNSTRLNEGIYALFNGSGKNIWLSFKLKTTGSQSNMCGIVLQANGQDRELRFNSYGLRINRGHGGGNGFADTTIPHNAVDNEAYINKAETTLGEKDGFLWSQHSNNAYGYRNSAVHKMQREEPNGGEHQIDFALYEGWLYWRVDGQVSGALKLSRLDESWTADTVYEIGLSCFDGLAIADKPLFSEFDLAFDKDAVGDGRIVEAGSVDEQKYTVSRMHWEPFTGTYLPASFEGGQNYILGEEGAQAGVSAHIRWMDVDNTGSAAGVTLEYGGKSKQFIVQGYNAQIRFDENRGWQGNKYNVELINQIAPYLLFNGSGDGDIAAYVRKDSDRNYYFYAFFNGNQVLHIDMRNIFDDYTPGDKVTLGAYCYDPTNGLAHFSDIKFGSADDFADANAPIEWRYTASVDDNIDNGQWTAGGKNPITEDMENGTFEEVGKNSGYLQFYGSSPNWQIDYTINRGNTDMKQISFYVQVKSLDGTTYRTTGWSLFGWLSATGKVEAELPSNAFNYPNRYTTVPTHTNLFWNRYANQFSNAEATRMSAKVRISICDDVLYLWSDTELSPDDPVRRKYASEDGLYLMARFPLTEKNFGGHKPGSNYRVRVYFDSTNPNLHPGDVKLTHISAKYGRAIPDDFMTVDGKKYTLEEAAAAIEKNITAIPWKTMDSHTEADSNSGELVLYGALAQALADYNRGGKTLAEIAPLDKSVYLSYDWQELDNTKGNISGGHFLSLVDENGTGRLVGSFFQSGYSGVRYGIYNGSATGWLNVGDKLDQGGKNDIPLYQHSEYNNEYGTLTSNFPSAFNSYVWSYKAGAKADSRFSVSPPAYGNTIHLEHLVAGGKLAIKVNGELALIVPLDKLCETWNENTKLRLGIYEYDPSGTDGNIYSNIVYKTGADAEAKGDLSGEIEGAQLNSFVYEPFDGTYIPTLENEQVNEKVIEKVKMMHSVLGKAVAGNQSISFRVKYEGKTTVSGNGIAVKNANGGEFYIVADGAGQVYFIDRLRGEIVTALKQYATKVNNADGLLPDAEIKPYSDGDGTVSAVLKDGVLYVSYNGKAAFSVKLSRFFDYKAEDPVSLGAASYNPAEGTARFSEFEYKQGDKVPGVDANDYLEVKLPAYRVDVPSGGSTFEEVDGKLKMNIKKESHVRLLADYTAWSVEGTVKRQSLADIVNSISFDIYTPGRGNYERFSFQQCGFYNGHGNPGMHASYFTAANTDMTRKSNTVENRKFHFRYDQRDWAGESSPHLAPQRDTMKFRIVIYNDMMYVWFDTKDEPGVLQLNMALPLTDEKFGGFPQGSKYLVTITSDTADITVTDCTVLAGEDLTSKEDFITANGEKYTVAAAAAAIKANTSRWNEYIMAYYRFYGELAEGIEEYRQGQSESKVDTEWSYASPTDLNGTQYLGAQVTRHAKADQGQKDQVYFGFYIQDAGGANKRLVSFGKNGLYMRENPGGGFTNSPMYNNHKANNYYQTPGVTDNVYVWVPDLTVLGKNGSEDYYKVVGEKIWTSGLNLNIKLEGAIIDNTFYVAVDGFTLFRVPLAGLCATWTPGTQYKIGFGVYEPFLCLGEKRYANVVALSGEEAEAKLNTAGMLEGASSDNMFYEAFGGTYAGSQAGQHKDKVTELLGEAQTGDQALSFKLRLESETSESFNGLALKSGFTSAYVLFGKDGKVHLLNQATANGTSYDGANGKEAGIAAFGTGAVDVTAVVKGGTLYVSVAGTPAFKVAVSKLISGYNGGELQLGIASYAPGKGLARFGELKAYSAGAEGFPPVAENDFTELSNAIPAQAGWLKRAIAGVKKIFGR